LFVSYVKKANQSQWSCF